MYVFVGYILMSKRVINVRIYLFIYISTSVEESSMQSVHGLRNVCHQLWTFYSLVPLTQDGRFDLVMVFESSVSTTATSSNALR